MAERSRSLSGFGLAAVTLVLAAFPVLAATCSVPTGSYPSIGTALADSGCATIDVAAGTYFENLSIDHAVVINGDASSPTVVDGGDGTGSVILASGTGYTFTINHLTLTNGRNYSGGGINIDGAITLNMNYCTVSGNTAVAPELGSGAGGGIFVDDVTLNLFNSTVANNIAKSGSDDCEVLGGEGGGIFQGNSTVNVIDSTIADNVAEVGDFATSGAGIHQAGGGSVSLTNTLVAGNTLGSVLGNCSQAVTDNGYNMSDDATCGLTGTGSGESILNLNLGTLTGNGGPTATIALLSGSMAIDQIPLGTNGCGTTETSDQRGVTRPQNGSCDIGAFEVCATGFKVTIQRGGPTTICAGSNTPLTAFPTGTSYKWFKNGKPAPGTNDEQTYYATETGKYTVTNSDGCTVTSSLAMPVTVLNDPVPGLSPIGPATVVCGKTVKLQATAGLNSYTWYRNNNLIPNAKTNVYIATSTGSYKVTVTNSEGCTGTSAAVVATVSCAP